MRYIYSALPSLCWNAHVHAPDPLRPSVCLSVWLFTKMLMLRAVDASFWFTTMASPAPLSRLLCFCNHRRRSFYFCCLSFTPPPPLATPPFCNFHPANSFCETVCIRIYIYMCVRALALHCAAALAPFHYCFHLHPFAAELLSELKSVVLATASRRRVFLINPPPPSTSPPNTLAVSAFIWITDKRDTRTLLLCLYLIHRCNHLRN